MMDDQVSEKAWELDDCTQAFIKAKRYRRRMKFMKFCEKVKNCFTKKNGNGEESPNKFNISILIGAVVLCCFGCVLFFMH